MFKVTKWLWIKLIFTASKLLKRLRLGMQQRKVLESDGWFCMDQSGLTSVSVFAEASRFCDDLIDNTPTVKSDIKPYIRYFVGGNFLSEHQHVEKLDPLLALGLDEAILSEIRDYFGTKFKLAYYELQETQKVETKQRTHSQRWHRDPGAWKIVKVFVYFNDVTSENGAFQYIPQTHNAGMKSAYYPSTRLSGGSYYPNDEDQECISTANSGGGYVEGRKGTIAMVDTVGLHRGGRVKNGNRRMATFVFVPWYDLTPIKLSVSKKLRASLSPLQQTVVKYH